MEIVDMEEKIKHKVNSLDIPGHLEAFCEELADLQFGTEPRWVYSDIDSDSDDIAYSRGRFFFHVRDSLCEQRRHFRPCSIRSDTQRIRKKYDFLVELKDVVNEELDSLRNNGLQCNCCQGNQWDALLGEPYGCDSVSMLFEHGEFQFRDNSIVEDFNDS